MRWSLSGILQRRWLPPHPGETVAGGRGMHGPQQICRCLRISEQGLRQIDAETAFDAQDKFDPGEAVKTEFPCPTALSG